MSIANGQPVEVGMEIDRLAALQEIDRRRKEQRDRIASLLSEADGCEQETSRQRELLERLTAEIEALEQRRAGLERKLDASTNKVRDNRMRMTAVRTNTELLALQREIDLAKEANGVVEEELLRVMEEVETLSAQRGEVRAAVGTMESMAEDRVAARRAEAESLRQALESENLRREKLAADMDPVLRGKYEQLFERRGGNAVVAVRGGICSGCRMHIPPQLFNEVQKLRDIRQCPNCHRILYWRPEPVE